MTNNVFEKDKAFGIAQSGNEYDKTLFGWALKYTKLGFSVIPIFHPGQTNFRGEISNGKDPAISKVEPYRDRLASVEELKKWFVNGSKINIAVFTGKASNIIALDIEGDNSKRDFQNIVKTFSKNLQIAIDETMHIKTGGGNALLIFRYDPNDFPNGIASEKMIAYLNHDEIAVSGNSRYVVMPPSIHKSGRTYELLSDNLLTLTKEEIVELLTKLRELKVKKTKSTSSSNVQNNITIVADLDQTAINEIVNALKPWYIEGKRHELVLFLSGYLRRHLHLRKEDILKIVELLDPGDQKNIEAVNDTYDDKNTKNISGYHALEETLLLITKDEKIVAGIFATLDRFKSKTTLLEQLSPRIGIQLEKHVFEVTSYNPLRFVIAHTEFRQIVDASVEKIIANGVKNSTKTKEDSNGEARDITPTNNSLKIADVIISAIPTKITCYHNITHSEPRYEIEFETSNGVVFTTAPKTIEEIITDLRARGLVFNIRYAEQKLAAILNAYQKEGKIILNGEIETPGFYLVNGVVISSKISYKQPTTNEIKDCIAILEKLVITWKRKEIFPTYLKWGLVAPFSYILKNYTWMHWLYAYGWTRTGKSVLGVIGALAPWKKHNDFTNHRIPFTKFDTEARIGHHISQDTFPIVVNECGALGEEKYRHLVEMLKNLVENKVARGRFTGRYAYGEIPALSPCILTSNNGPPDDPAFRARVVPIRFTTEDETTEEQKKEFNQWVKENIDKLGTLGDFAANYIQQNQSVLKNDWEDIGKIILAEFYKAAGAEQPPEWIEYFVEESRIVDAKQDVLFELRGFFLNIINDTYTKHYRTFTDIQDQGINHESLDERVSFCCRHRLVPFLIHKIDTGEIVITSDVRRELRRYKINNIASLAELARLIGFEYGSIWTDKTIKAAFGHITKFIGFLDLQ